SLLGSSRSRRFKPKSTFALRPSSVSSLSGIVSRMASSGGASRGSCTSVNTVCSDSDRGASLSSSASSASLQDGHSSSSSSSLPYGAVPAYSRPQRNGSDISLDLTPVSLLTGAGPLPASTTPLPKLTRLERVALEIVETEQAYVRDLKSIVEDYLGCIIDCGDLPLKPEEVSTLFCNIEDIYEFNSELLEDLERSPHAAAIAECFVERSEAFDIYTIYCMNYPNSVTVLRDCMKNESLVRFFQERQVTLCHSLPLETYLLKPVQRILKYHLLLQELSKHFDKSDPGYEVVEDAIITMTAVAWYINDMKRKHEHAVRLQEIESLLLNWAGPDLSGFGELVLEGSFRVQRVKKERAFFLFDKMLLIAKKRLDHFIYSTHIFCCNLLLVENMKDPLCFKVSDQTIPKQQHIVQAKNQEEKRLWLHYLKRMIVENHPASLPQKARQVLGDNFCQSPQFDQEPIRKPMPSPRLDDVHNYHRGRRQSEPPEFIYTPEKAKKSLPLLLEGNLPYKRGRRQSAPAKDIEAAFQQSGDEGELCPQADSMGSSGSTSTLASSVIEVESGRDDLALCQDEDDMTPLPPPPTLSITEEIMQFINESRARQGMAELTSEVVHIKIKFNSFSFPMCQLTPESPEVQPSEPQQLDESKPLIAEVDENKHQTNDTKRSEAEETLIDGSDKNEDSHPSCEAIVAPTEELEEASSLLQTSKEENQLGVFTLPEPTTDSSLVPKVEPEQKLTKSDKQIIEKIRSYYEAAEAGVEEGQTARRNSFSHIPAGLVKDSVSRFNVCVHQDSLIESESSPSGCVETDTASSLLPTSDQSDQTFNHEEFADTAIPHSDVFQEQKELLNSENANKKDEDICEFNPCMKLWKEKERTGQGSKNNLKVPFSKEKSCVSTLPEPFGHIILKEKLSTTYHQENDCNLIGPPDEISTNGSDSLYFSSAESSATSVQILTTVVESQISVISDHRESSLEKCESNLHAGDQSLSTCAGTQVQAEPEVPSKLARIPLDEHADNVLQSVQENHSHAVDKFTARNRTEEEPILQEENLAFVSNSVPSSELFIDPVIIEHLEEETHSVEEKRSLTVQHCESILSIDDKQDEIHTGHMNSKQDRADIETTSMEGITPVVSSVSEVGACPPLQPAPCVLNSVVISEGSELSYRVAQEVTTSPTQLMPLLGSCGKCSPLDVKSKGDLSNNSKTLSQPRTPPVGGPTVDELPRFTSQRPSNLPSTTGKRSPFTNWNPSSPATQRVPNTSLWTEEQIQDTSASGLSTHRQSFSQAPNDKPSNIPFGCGHPLDAKPPSAFSPNLRMRSPSPIRSAQNSRLSSTASALTKSLAASCISQTISQTMAKRGAHLQTASPPVSSAPLATSSVRLRSPSPKPITFDSSAESGFRNTSLGVGSQPLRSCPSPFRSNSLRSSPATVQTPPPYRSQRSISPAPPVSLHSTPSPNNLNSAALEQPSYTSLNGNNNNNNSLSNNGWATNHKKVPPSNTDGLPHFHDPQRTTLHNRVARPFPSSEPSSRVQSPSICPSPVTRICSPPPAPIHSIHLVTKPPNPRAPRQGGFFTPLSLEISRSTSACSLSPCESPRITSPPPIGIPASVWGFANPQPRNPSLTNAYSPTKVETNSTQRGTRIISPTPMGTSSCSATNSQSQRRLRGASLPFVALGDRPPSPTRHERRSWAESGRWSVGSELGLINPHGGSSGGSPSSISPGPLSPIRLTTERTTLSGKPFTSIAWPDVHDMLTKHNTEPSTETVALSCTKTEQDDIEVAESTCRSTLICPYVAPANPNLRESPIQCPTESKTEESIPNQGSKTTLKTSYATTVNLQIAGSGRIASFSNAQVSLTQTLSPVSDSQSRRRVSINSCNFSMQNCKRL
uniref:Pleckstrin homology domain containing, family G (with RhoGef domain) member 2 n=1 Tax=Cyprinus carpio TaxID=7962 RepID=A0A8C2FKM0_CYPCA